MTTLPIYFDGKRPYLKTVVAVAPSPAVSGPTLTLAAGVGALCPATPFVAGVYPQTGAFTNNTEFVEVTAVVGDVVTMTRAFGGTPRNILLGDAFAVMFDGVPAISTGGGGISAAQVAGRIAMRT